MPLRPPGCGSSGTAGLKVPLTGVRPRAGPFWAQAGKAERGQIFAPGPLTSSAKPLHAAFAEPEEEEEPLDSSEEEELEAASVSGRGPGFGQGTLPAARAGLRGVPTAAKEGQPPAKAELRSVPAAIKEDLMWGIWNEAWCATNRTDAAYVDDPRECLADAEEDERKSSHHFKAAQQKRVFPSGAVDSLRELAHEFAQLARHRAIKEDAPHEVPSVADLARAPPPGLAAVLWSRLLQAAHLAVASVIEDRRGNEEGAKDIESVYKEEWQELCRCVATPPESPRQPAAQTTKLRRGFLGPSGRLKPDVRPGPAGPRLDTGCASDSDSGSDGLYDTFDSTLGPDELLGGQVATALTSSDGVPAVVGHSMGLWLDPSDFVICCGQKSRVGLESALDVGAHGFPRHWPEVYSESSVLRGMLKRDGPCATSAVHKTPVPEAETMALVDGVPLRRLQSFANARAVKAKTGFKVVKGWAVYDISSRAVGEAYMAERYWWNTTGEDGRRGWRDFTPRPQGEPDLLLAEASEALPRRRSCVLGQKQLALAEGLLCLRFPEVAAARGPELGTEGAVTVALRHALRHAEAQGDVECRIAMANASLPGVPSEELSGEDVALLPLVRETVTLLETLASYKQRQDLQEQTFQALLDAGGVEAIASLLTAEGTEVAATAACALACICFRNPEAQWRARCSGAAGALADFHAREALRQPPCYAAEAATALWRLAGEAVQPMPSQALGVRRQPGLSCAAWSELLNRCEGELREEHCQEPPRLRRAKSWGRSLAFAQAVVGVEPKRPLRRGTEERPFVIWVLGAQDSVEASLAEEGYFADANWADRAPMEVLLFGEGLRELPPCPPPREGGPPAVRTASYREIPWLGHFGAPPPDLAVIFMPPVCPPGTGNKTSALPPGLSLPELAFAVVADVPTVITTRFGITEGNRMTVRCKLKDTLLVKHMRCPFGSAGHLEADFADNNWLFAVQGQGALAKALSLDVVPSVVLPYVADGQWGRHREAAIFWGILDIKYDTDRPVLERTKVLETGDGQTSKFSGVGADLKRRFESKYQLDKSVDLEMQHVIAADKKLTHDLVEDAGYGHIVPKQVCFPRQYTPDLAKRIEADLGLTEDDKVVLKLCNRSRAAGVVVTPVRELDEVLEDLLTTPPDLKGWLQDRVLQIMDVEGSPVDLGLPPQTGSFEEQRRHWWSNESPVFVAEVWCRSVPTILEGRAYDGTLRVGFALRRRQTPGRLPEAVTPEDMEVEWLGGYWKLPKSAMGSSSASLRDSVVSAARTFAVMRVDPTQLMETFAALGDVVQQLYGTAEPSSEELRARYEDPKEPPELAAILTARLGTATLRKRQAFAVQRLEDAEGMVAHLPEGLGKAAVLSFVNRARGVLDAVQKNPSAEEHFQASLRHLPANANAWHLVGLKAVTEGRPADAVEPLTKALLLDPDFKGAYVNLGLAYLRLGNWQRSIDVSVAGQARHADVAQFDYHIGVAYCQLALNMVNSRMATSDEMARATARKAELEEAARLAVEEVEVCKRAEEEARRAVREAKSTSDRRVAVIEEGTPLLVLEDIDVFESVESELETGQLRRGSKVCADGKPRDSAGCTWVPIQPRGAVNRRAVDVQVVSTEEKRALKEKDAKLKAAADARIEAVTRMKEARAAAQEAVPDLRLRPVAQLLPPDEFGRYEDWRRRSLEAFGQARDNVVVLGRRRFLESPFLDVDDEMVTAMSSGEGPVEIQLPQNLGWPSNQYKT